MKSVLLSGAIALGLVLASSAALADNPNDPALRSFIDVDPMSPFPIQNLPFGVFRRRDQPHPRVGVAIGTHVLDLAVIAEAGLLRLSTLVSDFFVQQRDLNGFMAQGRTCWRELRGRLSELLQHDTPTLRDDAALRQRALIPLNEVEMLMPARIRHLIWKGASTQTISGKSRGKHRASCRKSLGGRTG